MFAHKTIHINHQIAKAERCGNCRSRNRTHKLCTGTHKCLDPEVLQLTDCIEEASIAMFENAKALA